MSRDQHMRLYRQLSARGWRRAEPGFVPLERPTLLTEALAVHREVHGYSDADLAEIAGLDLDRLAELLPDHFTSPRRRPALSVVA